MRQESNDPASSGPARLARAISVTVFAGVVGCAFVQSVFAAEGMKAPKRYTNETTIYSGFNQDGRDPAYPESPPIEIKGTLYGTASDGGANTYDGAVYAVNASTGAETVLYNFCSQPNCADGWSPYSGLIEYKGLLYGTTYLGGANSDGGTVYSINPSTGAETVIYSFVGGGGSTDAQNPGAGNLLREKDAVFGTTTAGGAHNDGAVYTLNLKTGAESVVYSFAGGTDGSFPNSALIDVNGTLYGTTAQGGASGNGTVFAVNASTGAETVVYSFCSQQNCADGQAPVLGVLNANGTLYGVAEYGGANNNAGCENGNYKGCGVVYSVNPSTGAEKVVYSFCSQENCIDGQEPESTLVNVKGTLYGETFLGGVYMINGFGEGTVFALDPSTGKENVVLSLSGGDGQYPVGGLIHTKGALYGVTQNGGSYGFGSLFELTKP